MLYMRNQALSNKLDRSHGLTSAFYVWLCLNQISRGCLSVKRLATGWTSDVRFPTGIHPESLWTHPASSFSFHWDKAARA